MKVKPESLFFLIFFDVRPPNAFRYFFLFPVFVALLLFSCSPAVEDPKFRGALGKPGFRQQQRGRRVGIRPSGLQPVFPDNVRCPAIASPFGSQTRYDGSPRPSWAPGKGYHGGIDVSLAEGTPLLALSAGTVTRKGEGGQMLGIYLWLRHSPEDSGLPFWIQSKYQHLQSLPSLSRGARVAVGQIIALSGKTGTVGGHYGFYGYPHLHLTTRKSPNGEFEGSHLIDPLVIYHEASIKPKESLDPPPREKSVTIPYATTNGHSFPQGTRVVWPVACRRK